MKKVYKHALLKKYLYTLIAEEESEVSVADHYKGTPPLKSNPTPNATRQLLMGLSLAALVGHPKRWKTLLVL